MSRKPLTKKQREEVYNKYLGHCAYCGSKIDYKDMQVDHFAPYHLFGDNTQLSNLMPACRQCNFRKGTLTIEKFRSELEKTVDRLRRDNFMFRLAEKYELISCKNDAKIEFYYEQVNKFLESTKGKDSLDFSEWELDMYEELLYSNPNIFNEWYYINTN